MPVGKRLEWSPRAARDVLAIEEFYAKYSQITTPHDLSHIEEGEMVQVWSFFATVLLGTAVVTGTALAQPSVEYRNRGDRNEGIRALPVSGYKAELLSFRATYEEPLPAQRTPALYRLRFFLDKSAPAYVVVREVENKHSYWLDQVKPVTSWKPGFDNVFEWSTRDVIAQLPGPTLKLYDLGVTVRVGSVDPSDLERVAPAILYYSSLPPWVAGYAFVFKTNATARLEFSVEKSDGTPVKVAPEPRVLQRWSYGMPLRVDWDATNAEPGQYRLKMVGRVLENNERFGKEVEFFHQPKVH